jgi:hypothetical protein
MADVISQFLNDVAGGFFGNDYLRDYTHAAKTFRSAFYQNSPKFKFLFHVYFDLNVPGPTDANGSSANNFGLLVKNVKLPNYTFQTTELNQYNRKRIIQTKIKYDPVDVVFHDDNRNLITSLWYKYYTYYYNDATKPKVVFAGNRGGAPANQLLGGGVTGPPTEADYNSRNLYANSITGNDDWGYIGEPLTGVSDLSGEPVKVPFFKNITVFGLTQHSFVAYTLINPIITRFSHDTYDYEQSNGIMANTMTIEYETVVYNQGAIDGNAPDNILTGFGDRANYDRRLSPIATPGSNSNIFGRNGLIESAGGAIQQLTTPNGDILSAIRTAGAVVNSARNVNLVSSLQAELRQGLSNALQGVDNPTRQKLVDIPLASQTPSTVGTAGAPPIAQAAPQNIGNITNIVNNIVSVGTNTISNATNAIGGAIGSATRFAGVQNNTNGRVTTNP